MALKKKKAAEQKHHKKTDVEIIEQRIAIVREYAAHWEEYFKCFGTNDIRDRKVTEQEETQFNKLGQLLARKLFRFSNFVGDKFGDSSDILELLRANESLAQMQEFSDANFKKTEVTWHQIFINMHRAIGRLQRDLPVDEENAPKLPPPAGAKASTGGGGGATPKARPGSGPSMPKPGMPKPGGPKPPGPPKLKGP